MQYSKDAIFIFKVEWQFCISTIIRKIFICNVWNHFIFWIFSYVTIDSQTSGIVYLTLFIFIMHQYIQLLSYGQIYLSELFYFSYVHILYLKNWILAASEIFPPFSQTSRTNITFLNKRKYFMNPFWNKSLVFNDLYISDSWIYEM